MSRPESIENMLERIAFDHLGIETLAVRGRDRLDFHDVGVAALRCALVAAFEAGRTFAADPTNGTTFDARGNLVRVSIPTR